MNASSTITMKTVARAAGLSQPAVSMALRNHPRIGAETRKRVKALARELGYRPDPALAALAAYRRRGRSAGDHGVLAVLNAWGAPETQVPQYFRNQLAGVRERAAELGYRTEVFDTPAEPAAQRRLGRVLAARGIQGVVVGPVPAGFPGVSLDWKPFAAVAVGYSLAAPRLHTVAGNHALMVETIYEELRRRGYRRIGFCNEASAERRNRGHWLAAYLKCRVFDEEAGGEAPPLLHDGKNLEEAPAWVRRHGLDAIIGDNLPRLTSLLRKAGHRIPRDLGLASLSGVGGDGDERAGAMDSSRLLGASSVDAVHAMLLGGERGVPARRRMILIDGVWKSGTTVRERT